MVWLIALTTFSEVTPIDGILQFNPSTARGRYSAALETLKYALAEAALT